MTGRKCQNPKRPPKKEKRPDETAITVEERVRRMDAILGPFICTTEQDLDRVMSLAEEPGWCPVLVLSRDESRWRLFILNPEAVDLPPRPPVRPN